tara:strand:+ start:46 stop:600 length:555 start_codon:yes stop_codon:yes gene_type:complete
MFKAYFYLFCAFMTVVFMYLSIQTSSAETNTVSSTVVNNTPPTANAPVLPNSNSDICKVGIGGAVQNNVLGIATGVLVDDELCQLLKLSRSQYAFGMKVSAVAILCQDARVWDSMADAGTPCPVRGFIGAEAEQYWLDHPQEIPEGSRYKAGYVAQVKVEEQPKGDVNAIKNFGLIALSMLLLL